MTEQVSLKVVVIGRVQGVSFREFTRRKARELGLVGYVRNLPEGSVEFFAGGSRSALEKLLAYVRQGPPQAFVYNTSVTWGKYPESSTSFEIEF